MKKILLVAPQYYPIPAVKGGAVEVLITHLIEENEKHAKAKMFVISKSDKDAEKIRYKYTKVFYVDNENGSSFLYNLRCFFRKIVFNRLTKKIFKKSQYGFQELTFFGYQCKKIAKKIKPDVIVSESYDHVHRLWPLVKMVGKENFYYHLHYTKEEVLNVRKLIPNTIAISQFVLDHWVKDKSLPGKNVVLFNGIDINVFTNKLSKNERDELRKVYGFKDDDFVILFTGRFRPHKGVLELLKAFDLIKKKDIKLLLVGSFLSESKEHDIDESEFENSCLSIINNNSNIIRVGNVDYQDINKFYFISDIQIIPSMWEEGAGLVAIEGMAGGLPLIITDSGGMPEYTGKECAIIVDRDENLIDNLSKSMVELYSNKELCKKMSEAGKNRAKLFSKENYYKNYIDILSKEEAPNG